MLGISPHVHSYLLASCFWAAIIKACVDFDARSHRRETVYKHMKVAVLTASFVAAAVQIAEAKGKPNTSALYHGPDTLVNRMSPFYLGPYCSINGKGYIQL